MTRQNKADFRVPAVCEATVLELLLDWAVIAVQEASDGWPLLYTVSLMFDAAAGIHEVGGVDAYHRYTPKGICSLQCFGYETDHGFWICDSVEQLVDLEHALGAILKLW